MRDRVTTVGPIAAVVGAVGVCCGLPILLSLGVFGAITGLSVQSWVLVGLGLALIAVGWARLARARRPHGSHCQPGLAGPLHAGSARSSTSTTSRSNSTNRSSREHRS